MVVRNTFNAGIWAAFNAAINDAFILEPLVQLKPGINLTERVKQLCTDATELHAELLFRPYNATLGDELLHFKRDASCREHLANVFQVIAFCKNGRLNHHGHANHPNWKSIPRLHPMLSVSASHGLVCTCPDLMDFKFNIWHRPESACVGLGCAIRTELPPIRALVRRASPSVRRSMCVA